MVEEHAISGYLVALIALGVVGQWIASRTHSPSVLWMLGLALIVGPATNWLRPNEMFGDLLLPLVSLSVAVILFEGSLELRLADLRHIGRPLFRLLTVGALATAVLTAWLATEILGMSWPSASLLGAILVVTGPTVIGPILAAVRPSARVAQLLRWEGIAIDPLGAVAALLVFESIQEVAAGEFSDAGRIAATQLLTTVVVGTALGYVGARLLTYGISRFWIPDSLHGVSSLGILLVVFELSNRAQTESGLLAATIMGIVVTNTKHLSLQRVHRFHQNLSMLFIPTLFLLLGARLEQKDLLAVGWAGLAFAIALVLLVRPTAVFLSMIGLKIPWRERVFVAFLAPRGIVAAAVSSLFALRLGEGYEALVPATFIVIITTVAIYGISASFLARALGLSTVNPQGCLILGANQFGRELAKVLQEEEIKVALIDNNRQYVEAARMMNLSAKFMNILSDEAHGEEEIDFSGIGSFLALTSNNEVNILACRHFAEVLGSKNVFQLAPATGGPKRTTISGKHLAGRILFADGVTHEQLLQRLRDGYKITATQTTKQFTPADFLKTHTDLVVLFTISKQGTLSIRRSGSEGSISQGSTIIALRPPSSEASASSAPDETASSSTSESTDTHADKGNAMP